MANKSIKRNYIYNVVQQILILLTPLITAPYISRVLGADGIGTTSYTTSIVSYFSLFSSLGIASYGQREISYAQDNKLRITEVFWNAKLLNVITTSICLIFYVLYVTFFDKAHTAIYIILSIELFSVLTDVSWLFQGMEEFGIIVVRNIACRLLNVAGIFILVHSREDITIYIFVLTFSTFLCNASLWTLVPKFVYKPNFRNLHPFSNFKTIISLFIPTIAISIYTMLDKTMIGIFTSNSFENGYYEQATKLSKMVTVLITSLCTVMIPRIGHHFEKKETILIRDFMYRSYRFVWFLGIPLCAGLIGVAPNFIQWFYGDAFKKVIPILSILSLLILAIGINSITGVQYLVPTKRQNKLTLSVLFGAFINIICNLILIPRLQAIGAAIGSVIAESSIAIVQLWIVRKELSSIQIITSSIIYLLAGGIMYAVLFLENKLLSPAIFHTFLMIMSGIFTYFTVLYVLKDDFFIENTKKFFEKTISKIKH